MKPNPPPQRARARQVPKIRAYLTQLDTVHFPMGDTTFGATTSSQPVWLLKADAESFDAMVEQMAKAEFLRIWPLGEWPRIPNDFTVGFIHGAERHLAAIGIKPPASALSPDSLKSTARKARK